MIDRGIIKWQPFNSCFNPELIIKNININKMREIPPTLSEDQLNNLENLIKEAYNLKLYIKLKYYYDGKIKEIIGKINKVSNQEKKLYLNNTTIYFTQVLEIIKIDR